MPKEYIERGALLKDLGLLAMYQYGERKQGILGVRETIKNRTAADVEEVVKCKNCTFWDREHISCEGLARCLTGESGIRYRSCKDYCSRDKRKEL